MNIKTSLTAIAAMAIRSRIARTLFLKEFPMLNSYVRVREGAIRLRQLATDQSGVVSFEYVIVAACIVAAVLAAFGTDTKSGIGLALSDEITKIVGKLP
jgi:Flp pilus assembly pilin Flp